MKPSETKDVSMQRADTQNPLRCSPPASSEEVVREHSFRIREGVQFDVQTVWPLLAGVIPNDPSIAPPFVDPRESFENPVPEGVLEDV